MIATKIFWALGYNQVESYLTTFDPKHVDIDPKATVDGRPERRTPFTRDDMNAILERVARKRRRHLSRRRRPADSRQDPRQLPLRRHAPRRSQRHRAARASARAAGAARLRRLDQPDRPQGRQHARCARRRRTAASVVKHYLQDVGSTFGMCNDKHEWDMGWEHFFQTDTTMKRLFSFGFALSPWQTVPYYANTRRSASSKATASIRDLWRPQTPTHGVHGAARRRRVLGGATRGGVHRRPDPRRGTRPGSSAIPPPKSTWPTC